MIAMTAMTAHLHKLRAAGLALLAACALPGCAPTQFETASDNIPQPLIDRIPVVVGVHIPAEFRDKVYTEKRAGGQYSIGLGKAQSDGFLRMMQAMFTRVVLLESPADAATTDAAIRGVLEPALEDYAFVTPSDSGTDSYSASLKYTVRLYTPKGELSDSWTFTGYGSRPSSMFPGKGDDALKAATAAAMRDAAAKLVAEFKDQAIARGLLPGVTAPVATEVTLPPNP
jgi:hypothetical protein